MTRDDVDPHRDQLLVHRYQSGDGRAFDELYLLYRERLRRSVIKAVGPADADDVVQEAFLAVWRRLPALRRGEQVYAYLAVTARHLAAARRESPADQLGADPPAAASAPPPEVDLAALPPLQRAVVERRVLDGLSRRATAAALDLPPGEVDQLLDRALSRLRVSARTR